PAALQAQEDLARHDLPDARPPGGLGDRGPGADPGVRLPLRAPAGGGAPRPPDLQRVRARARVLRAADREPPGRGLRAVRLPALVPQPPDARDLPAVPPARGPADVV